MVRETLQWAESERRLRYQLRPIKPLPLHISGDATPDHHAKPERSVILAGYCVHLEPVCEPQGLLERCPHITTDLLLEPTDAASKTLMATSAPDLAPASNGFASPRLLPPITVQLVI